MREQNEVLVCVPAHRQYSGEFQAVSALCVQCGLGCAPGQKLEPSTEGFDCGSESIGFFLRCVRSMKISQYSVLGTVGALSYLTPVRKPLLSRKGPDPSPNIPFLKQTHLVQIHQFCMR